MKALLFKFLLLSSSTSVVAITPTVSNILKVGAESYCTVTFRVGEASETSLVHFSDEDGTTKPYTNQRSFRVSRGWTWKKAKEIYQLNDLKGVNKKKVVESPFAESTYDFGYWSVDEGVHQIEDNYEFNDDIVTIKPRWYISSRSDAFVQDTWESISTIASKGYEKDGNKYYGLEALIKYYSPKNNTFVITDLTDTEEVSKKTRTVKLGKDENGNPLTYKVRVVAENHDIVSGNNNELACLTFEFCDVIKRGIAFDKADVVSKEDSNYSKAGIRTYIDGVIYPKLDSDVKSAMTTVTKKTVKQEFSNPVKEEVLFDTKLYLPSCSEISNDNEKDDIYYYSGLDNENNCFDFSELHNSDADKLYRTKNYYQQTGTDYMNYFLRSLFNSNRKEYYDVNQRQTMSIVGKLDGYSQNPGTIDRKHYLVNSGNISPVFSIGVDKATNKVEFNGSDCFELHTDNVYSPYIYKNRSYKNFTATIFNKDYETSPKTPTANDVAVYFGSTKLASTDYTVEQIKSGETDVKGRFKLTILNSVFQNHTGDIKISLYM